MQGSTFFSQRMSATMALLPGILLACGIALFSVSLGTAFPVVGAPVFGILLGLALSTARRPSAAFAPGLRLASRQLLQWAIILMGFGLSFGQVLRIGGESLWVMLSTLVVCLAASVALAKWLGVSSRLTALVGAGTGICGASAIAAVAPVVQADEQEVAYALSTVFAFNVVAVLTFPPIGHFLGFSQQAFGLWAGTAVNDTSSVVATAYAYGVAAGDYATVVKLARATMIVPVTLLIAALRPGQVRTGGIRIAKMIPWFIVGFLGAALLRSAGVVPASAVSSFPVAGRFLMVVALSAVGLSANLRAIAGTGWRPLALGAVLWILVAVTSVIMQQLLGQT